MWIAQCTLDCLVVIHVVQSSHPMQLHCQQNLQLKDKIMIVDYCRLGLYDIKCKQSDDYVILVSLLQQQFYYMTKVFQF